MQPGGQKSGKRTILVVDDEESIAEALVTLLEDEGYRVLSAIDGQEALEVARQESVDLYLSDVMMPTMDGPEFARALREAGVSDRKVIFMTAVPQAVDQAEFGGILVLKKPFQIEKLLNVIENRLD